MSRPKKPKPTAFTPRKGDTYPLRNTPVRPDVPQPNFMDTELRSRMQADPGAKAEPGAKLEATGQILSGLGSIIIWGGILVVIFIGWQACSSGASSDAPEPGSPAANYCNVQKGSPGAEKLSGQWYDTDCLSTFPWEAP